MNRPNLVLFFLISFPALTYIDIQVFWQGNTLQKIPLLAHEQIHTLLNSSPRSDFCKLELASYIDTASISAIQLKMLHVLYVHSSNHLWAGSKRLEQATARVQPRCFTYKSLEHLRIEVTEIIMSCMNTVDLPLLLCFRCLWTGWPARGTWCRSPGPRMLARPRSSPALSGGAWPATRSKSFELWRARSKASRCPSKSHKFSAFHPPMVYRW